MRKPAPPSRAAVPFVRPLATLTTLCSLGLLSACGADMDEMPPDLDMSLYSLVTTASNTYLYPPLAPLPAASGTFDPTQLSALTVVLEATDAAGQVQALGTFDERSTPALKLLGAHELYFVNVPAATYFTDPSLAYAFRVLQNGVEIARSDMSSHVFTVLHWVPALQVGVKIRIEQQTTFHPDGYFLFTIDESQWWATYRVTYGGFSATCPASAHVADLDAPALDMAAVTTYSQKYDSTGMWNEWGMRDGLLGLSFNDTYCIPGLASDQNRPENQDTFSLGDPSYDYGTSNSQKYPPDTIAFYKTDMSGNVVESWAWRDTWSSGQAPGANPAGVDVHYWWDEMASLPLTVTTEIGARQLYVFRMNALGNGGEYANADGHWDDFHYHASGVVIGPVITIDLPFWDFTDGSADTTPSSTYKLRKVSSVYGDQGSYYPGYN